MRHFNLKYIRLILLVLSLCINTLSAQIPDFSRVPNMHEGDSLNITLLINNGVKIIDGKIIAWFPRDSMNISQMKEITSMLNRGIRAVNRFIKAPLSWQVRNPGDSLTYYFRPDRFVSHASKAGFVCIPFWRIKAGKAPWLHEALHEILDTKSGNWYTTEISEKEFDEHFPHWLFEGLPDYIALNVSLTEDMPFFDVFSNNYQTDFDSLFKSDLKSDKGRYILSFIGSKGVIPQLSGPERNSYAPAFYHGSASFVKFLVNKYNLQVLLTAISSYKKEIETLETTTGKPIHILKKEWLKKLNIVE